MLVICDLNLLTGDFVRAFLKVISELPAPVYFFGATASDTHGKWIEEMTKEFLLAESDKGVALQGLQFPEEKPPDLGKLPEAPKLNICCWKSDHTGIQIPKVVVDRWPIDINEHKSR